MPNYFTATVILTQVFYSPPRGRLYLMLGYDFWTCSFNQQSSTSTGEFCFLVLFSGLIDGSQFPCTVAWLNHPGIFFLVKIVA